MADHDDGGPAFPVPLAITPDGDWVHSSYPGMSLREWFAGQALAAIANTHPFADKCSEHAYKIADAMIAAKRAREGGR